MREIKFRAWNKTTKNMIVDYAHVGHYGELYTTQFHSSAYSDKGCPELILLQFTGIRDANDVEIYEGDVVKAYIYHEEEPQILPVHYVETAFVIDYEDSESDRIPVAWFVGSLEVIGNIYEHFLELLKESLNKGD